MRYWIGFAMAALVSPLMLPAVASAQVGAEAAGVAAAPVEATAWHAKPEASRIGYVDDLELRTRAERSKTALAVSVVPLAVGLVTFGASYADFCMHGFLGCEGDECCSQIGNPTRTIGAGIMLGGAVWAAIAGTVLGVSKQKLRKRRAQRELCYGTQRRVQWDLAHSRLVF